MVVFIAAAPPAATTSASAITMFIIVKVFRIRVDGVFGSGRSLHLKLFRLSLMLIGLSLRSLGYWEVHWVLNVRFMSRDGVTIACMVANEPCRVFRFPILW